MGRKFFVSGPIQGMKWNQYYRGRLRKLLLRYGYEPMDPWRREKILYRGPPEEWWRNVLPKGFIQRDLEDIERCDALIAYLPRFQLELVWSSSTPRLKEKRP